MADAIEFDIVCELDRGHGPVYHHMFNFCLFVYLFRYLAYLSDHTFPLRFVSRSYDSHIFRIIR